MFGRVLFSTLLAALAVVRADPTPSEPGPGDAFNEGQQCHIAWEVDTTGTWKTMNIELMTGNNIQMVHLTTVATVDGTDPTKTTFDYPCPQVTPNAPIYFYQFTSPSAATTLWTTRFAIADNNGHVDPANQTTQPDGQQIPWGTGALVDPSTAVPPPAKGSAAPSGSSNSSASSFAAPSGASSRALSSPAPSTPPATVSEPSASGQGSASPNATGAAKANNTNAAAGGVFLDSRLIQAVSALAVVGATFAIAF